MTIRRPVACIIGGPLDGQVVRVGIESQFVDFVGAKGIERYKKCLCSSARFYYVGRIKAAAPMTMNRSIVTERRYYHERS